MNIRIRRPISGPCAFQWLAFLALTAAGFTASARPPNVVFFLVDDLGWRDLGYSGSSFYETPNVDRLAAGGMVFTNGYAACPVCSPSRAAILSGKCPARMNTTDWFGGNRQGKLRPADYQEFLSLEEATLAEAFREAGYTTFFAGKWHLGKESYYPEYQGFDYNIGGIDRGSPPGGYFSPYRNPRLPDGPEGECLPDRLGDETVQFIRQHQDRPFLVYLSFYSVHTPLQTKDELENKYSEKASALPEGKGARQVYAGSDFVARTRQNHPVYAGMIQSVDDNVGKVLAAIGELGLSEDTIVCFTSDNGGLSTAEGSPTSNAPLRGGKGWLYEGGIRVPFIISWPGTIEGGRQTQVPAIGNDFYPTLLELAGLPLRPGQHIDAVSLAPVLAGREEGLPGRSLFWHYPHYSNQGGRAGSAIRDGRWKLIETFDDGMLELYDLEADIGETRDLSASMPERVRALHGKLRAWRVSVDARMMQPKPDSD